MNCHVLSCNFSAWKDLKEHLEYAGLDVTYREVPGEESFDVGFKVGRECALADIVFFEFAQWPIRILPFIPPDKKIIVRLKRIELYRESTYDPEFDWSRVNLLICSAEHVKQRFLKFRAGKSLPKKIITIPTNIVERTELQEKEKEFIEPLNFIMAGNVVPKKRQYTAIQMLADLDLPWTLYIVGPSGVLPGYGNPEYLTNIEDLTDILGIPNDKMNIEYTKWLEKDELVKLYHKCHFIISMSNEEGSHKAIAEAMSYGCIPLLNCWRGVDEVYPKKWVFKTPNQFIDLIKQHWYYASNEQKMATVKEVKDYVFDRYDKDIINEMFKKEIGML